MHIRFLILALIVTSYFIYVKVYGTSFCREYKYESFDDYRNLNVFIREYRDRGGLALVIIINDSVSHRLCYSMMGTVIDVKKMKIVKVDSSLQDDTCHFIDRKRYPDLALRFMKYDLGSLKVDSVGNVFVGYVKCLKDWRLARLTNPKYVPKKNWKWIGENNWYQEIDR